MKPVIKVLLVEDSIEDSTLILEILNEEKIAVDVDLVRDGELAIAYLNKTGEFKDEERPDIVILDLNLPKMDGREVLLDIKANPTLSSIPVIILTTSQSEEDIARSYRLQASCYVTKPIDLESFHTIIRAIDRFWFSAVRYPCLL